MILKTQNTLLQQQFNRWRRRHQAQWNAHLAAIRILDPLDVYVPNPENRENTWTTRPRLLLRDKQRRQVVL